MAQGTATTNGYQSPPSPPAHRGQGGSRWYHWLREDGKMIERFWSVTHIIDNGIPKEALVGWAAKQTALAAVDNLDIVQAMLAKGQREQAIKYLTDARFETTRVAKLTGSQIHEAMEAYHLGRPFAGVPDAVRPYYEALLRLLEAQKPIVLATEAQVLNRSRRYGGTLDGIGVFPELAGLVPRSCPNCRTKMILGEGHRDDCPTPDLPVDEFTYADPRGPVVMFDAKTGKGPRRGGAYPESALQLAAYENAEFMGLPDGSEVPLPAIDGCAVLHLQPGWSEVIPVWTGPEVYDAFLYAREIVRWKDETSKRVIGRPVRVYELPPPEVVADPWQPPPRRTLHLVGFSRVPKEGDDLPRHAVTNPPEEAPPQRRTTASVKKPPAATYLAECGALIRHVPGEGFDPGSRKACEQCAPKAQEAIRSYEAERERARRDYWLPRLEAEFGDKDAAGESDGPIAEVLEFTSRPRRKEGDE